MKLLTNLTQDHPLRLPDGFLLMPGQSNPVEDYVAASDRIQTWWLAGAIGIAGLDPPTPPDLPPPDANILEAIQEAVDALEARLTSGLTAKVPAARTITGTGLATGGGDLTMDRMIAVLKASQAETSSGTLDDRAVTPLSMAPALAGKAPIATQNYWLGLSLDAYLEGAAGNGTSDDDGPALTAALNKAAMLGKRLIVPPKPSGVPYLCKTSATCSQSGNTHIEFLPGAVLKSHSTLTGPLLRITRPAGEANHITIKGPGLLDVSASPPQASGGVDALSINEGFENVAVDGLTFYHGAHYTTGGADSSIFVVGRTIRITNCFFSGAVDAAIYASATQSEVGGKNLLISGNQFSGCNVDVILKRQFLNGTISANFSEFSNFGISTGEADTSLLPGRQLLIIGNTLDRPASTGIEARWSSDTSIIGNRVTDVGVRLDNSTDPSATGISIAGSSNCSVVGNVLRQTSGPLANGIVIKGKLINGVTRQSTDNTITGNAVSGFTLGIGEGDTSQDFNTISSNRVRGCTTQVDRKGVSTTADYSGQRFLVAETGETAIRQTVTGAASSLDLQIIARGTGAVNFYTASSVTRPIGGFATDSATPVNWVQIAGHAAGSSPRLSAVGSDSNIDLALNAKGSGVLKFGTLTTNADAPVTGYITIKDSAGNTRKLAVIA